MSLELTTATDQQLSGIRETLKTVGLVGDETISGIKTFDNDLYLKDSLLLQAEEGRPKISGRLALTLKNQGASHITLEYEDGDKIYLTAPAIYNNSDDIRMSSRPFVNDSGILLSGDPLVYTINNQTISGIKDFKSRPTFNGTGLLVSGDTIPLPSTLVYATGNQTISGIKDFKSRPTLNGIGVLVRSDSVVYATGNQAISGIKNFGDTILGKTGTFDKIFINNLITESGIWANANGESQRNLIEYIESWNEEDGYIYNYYQTGSYDYSSLGNFLAFRSGNQTTLTGSVGTERISRNWSSSVFRAYTNINRNNSTNTTYYELAYQYTLKINNFDSGTKYTVYTPNSDPINPNYQSGLILFSNTQNPSISDPYYCKVLDAGNDITSNYYIYKLPTNYWVISGNYFNQTSYLLQSTTTGNSLSLISWPGIGATISLTNNSKTWILKYIDENQADGGDIAINKVLYASQNTNSNFSSNSTYDWGNLTENRWIFSTDPYRLPAAQTIKLGNSGSSEYFSKLDHSHPFPRLEQIVDNYYIANTTSDQTISGIKTFASIPTFQGANFLYSGSDINNSNLNSNLFYSSQASGYLTGIGYSGNYDGGYFIGKTKLSQNTSRLIDSSFGNIWTRKLSDTTRTWGKIAISSDGKYQIAGSSSVNGYIYVSADYGNTWVSKITDQTRSWTAVGISADGKYQTACPSLDFIRISSDYGNTWTTPLYNPGYNFHAGISISSNGKYQTIVATSNKIYLSSNYGNSWQSVTSSNQGWQSVSISNDGKYQTAVASLGYIYISADYGITWTSKITDTTRYWTSVSVSADGKYQTAVHRTGKIYVSSDYGNTWVAKDINREWTSVSVSADGKYQIAGVNAGQIYVSSDYGNNWSAKNSSRNWTSVSVSADGKYQAVVASSDYLYISKTDELIDGNLYVDNLYATTGFFSISGATALALPNNPLSVVGSGNSYVQVNIQNRASGTTATADLVITANNGSDSSNFINLGINNSGYNDPTFSNGSGLDGYLFINGGSLDIGTQTANTNIEFHIGGTTLDKTIARITSNGLNIVSGDLTASNIVYNTGNQTISGTKTIGNLNTTNLFFQNNTDNFGITTQLQDGDLSFSNKSGAKFAISYLSAPPYTGLNVIETTPNNTTIKLPPNKNDFIAMSSEVVYNTGNQTISGIKTFNVAPIVSGNPLITGVNLSSYITTSQTGNFYSTSNPSGYITGISNIVYNTGAQNISGNKTFFDSGVFSLNSASPLSLPNNPLSIVGSGNSYMQLNIQNRATGTDASADLVITANNGTDSSNYINLGINNSGYNNASYNNATGYDGYLFIDGGDLDIGTRTPGKIVEFHAGGTTESKVIARISESGLNLVSGNLTVGNTGVLLSGQNRFVIQASTSQSNFSNANTMYYFMGHGAGYASARTDRTTPFLESCTVKKVSFSLNQSTGSTVASNLTGFFINTTKNLTGIVFSGVSSTNDANFYHYTNNNLNIPFAEGDSGVCAIYTTTSNSTNIRTMVNIYCYS
jgi:hypothetical protein